MQNTIVQDEGAVSLEVARTRVELSGSIIKIGLDVHARIGVSAAEKLSEQQKRKRSQIIANLNPQAYPTNILKFTFDTFIGVRRKGNTVPNTT
jgi:hypothetical protein